MLLTACTGSGGGYLPPGPTASDTFPITVFTGKASFGFNFSCEDSGGVNPSTRQLRIQLTCTDHGPSSSATTSTTDRALPSSAVQLRCWSRPTTTMPLERGQAGMLS